MFKFSIPEDKADNQTLVETPSDYKYGRSIEIAPIPVSDTITETDLKLDRTVLLSWVKTVYTIVVAPGKFFSGLSCNYVLPVFAFNLICSLIVWLALNGVDYYLRQNNSYLYKDMYTSGFYFVGGFNLFTTFIGFYMGAMSYYTSGFLGKHVYYDYNAIAMGYYIGFMASICTPFYFIGDRLPLSSWFKETSQIIFMVLLIYSIYLLVIMHKNTHQISYFRSIITTLIVYLGLVPAIVCGSLSYALYTIPID